MIPPSGNIALDYLPLASFTLHWFDLALPFFNFLFGKSHKNKQINNKTKSIKQ